MTAPVKHRMGTSLRAFERAVQDGTLVREGARVDAHACKLQEAWRQRTWGTRQPYRGEDIAPGEKIERVWQCRKPGLAQRFGMEDFDHREVFDKSHKARMSMTDHLTWHEGTSRAHRRYVVEGDKDGITVTLDPWMVKMNGVGGKLAFLRGQLERTMRQQFPKRVDQPLLGVLAGLRHESPRAASLLSPSMLAHARDMTSHLVTLFD